MSVRGYSSRKPLAWNTERIFHHQEGSQRLPNKGNYLSSLNIAKDALVLDVEKKRKTANKTIDIIFRFS